MSKKLLIFGAGDFAKQMKYYFEQYADCNVEAFVVDREFLPNDKIENINVVAFEDVLKTFPPDEYDFFVATGYSDMNKTRMKKIAEIKKMSYFMPSFIHPSAFVDKSAQLGQNCVVLENSVVQPNAILKDGVIVWASSVICHDSIVKDCSFIGSGACVNGFTKIGKQCFLGANSTIRDKIVIADFSLIGAGCTILKNTDRNSVYKAVFNKVEINSMDVKI